MDLNASLGQSVSLRLFRAPLNEHLIFAKHLTAAVKTEEFLAGMGLVTRRAARPLRWVLRLGAAASLLFVGVMIRQGHLCPYCVAVHAGNLLFVGLCEWKWARSVADVADDSTAMRLDPAEPSQAQAPRQAVPSRSGLPGFVAIFGLTSAVLGGYEWQMQAARAREVQEGLLASLDRVSESIPAQETTDAQPVMTPGRYVQGPADARRTSWSSPTTSVPPTDGCTNSSRS